VQQLQAESRARRAVVLRLDRELRAEESLFRDMLRRTRRQFRQWTGQHRSTRGGQAMLRGRDSGPEDGGPGSGALVLAGRAGGGGGGDGSLDGLIDALAQDDRFLGALAQRFGLQLPRGGAAAGGAMGPGSEAEWGGHSEGSVGAARLAPLEASGLGALATSAEEAAM